MTILRPILLLFLLINVTLVAQDRPLPYPVVPDKEFTAAVKKGTRTLSGQPGEGYWQNDASYRIHARLLPDLKRLEGRVHITFVNNSPDTLRNLNLSLLQNLHKEGAARHLTVEVTDGFIINNVSANGDRLVEGRRGRSRYLEYGTTLYVYPKDPTPPGGTATLEIDYAFVIPQQGISARMGYDTDSLYYIGYWYPHMQVYNDVVGWQSDVFLGGAEFYSNFADYEYTIEMPDDWLVWGTGVLQNEEENFSEMVYERLSEARESDDTYRIVGPEDFGKTTRAGKNGWLTWRFEAEQVRDVAWLATRHSIWEAARVPLQDDSYSMVHAFWRETAPFWRKSVEFSQKSIAFLSEYTSIAYPWPHMTAVEAGRIIGGGMEFPMMTICGDYNRRGLRSLLGVTAHEEAHMWVPMIVNVDERRYGWMDEGTTSFHTEEALWGIIPDSMKAENRHNSYLAIVRAGREGEIMRWTNFHYDGWASGTASYGKPASVLHMLKGVLGEEVFLKAFRTYLTTWAWKHPYPWDMFNTFSAVSGKDLDWFMRAWYYETWTLDQAIADVQNTSEGTQITIEDKGWVPMPVLLTVTHDDGTSKDYRISEQEWLAGKTTASITVPAESPIVKVEIDPTYYFADLDRKNNVWERAEGSEGK